jgi:hypothetical protein
MAVLYRRRARLSVGPPGGELKIWEGLRIVFNITKTIDAEPNKASIQIYNLNQDSRDRIQRKRDVVKLEIAYGNEPLEEIFNGEIRFVDHRKQNADMMTAIESGDGDTPWSDIHLSETMGARNVGTSVSQVFARLKQIFNDEMRNHFGTDPSIVADFDAIIDEITQEATSDISVIFRKGISLRGEFGKVMDRMCERVGLNFFINNQTMYVLKQTATLNLEPILLTPETGLIGSPRKTEDGGLQVKSLIVPGLLVGREIVVESREVSGLRGWKITRLNLRGDTEGDDWTATTDSELLGAVA